MALNDEIFNFKCNFLNLTYLAVKLMIIHNPVFAGLYSFIGYNLSLYFKSKGDIRREPYQCF